MNISKNDIKASRKNQAVGLIAIVFTLMGVSYIFISGFGALLHIVNRETVTWSELLVLLVALGIYGYFKSLADKELKEKKGEKNDTENNA